MFLTVNLRRIVEEQIVLDVKDYKDAKIQIEALVNDDFQEIDRFIELDIEDENGKDVEGLIQPYTPKLGN